MPKASARFPSLSVQAFTLRQMPVSELPKAAAQGPIVSGRPLTKRIFDPSAHAPGLAKVVSSSMRPAGGSSGTRITSPEVCACCGRLKLCYRRRMSRLIDLMRHLGPTKLLRFGALDVARRTLARDAKISFAQNGEDLVLDSLLGHRRLGFYVDVGCNHPTNISNSYRFYLRGWSGIAIDANKEFASDWARLRPRDTFRVACISDDEREVEFKVFNSRALSSIGGQRFYPNDEHYRLVRVDRMKTQALTDLLDDCSAPREFAFLSADVEGHDFEVIRSLDLDRYSPEVILVELNGTDIDLGNISCSPIATHLARYSYRPQAALSSNVFFRRQ